MQNDHECHERPHWQHMSRIVKTKSSSAHVLAMCTPILLDDFTPTLARLLEHLSINKLEAQEQFIIAAINIGTLLEYS